MCSGWGITADQPTDWSDSTLTSHIPQDLPEEETDQPATPGDGEIIGEGDSPAGAGGVIEGDVAVIVGLKGLHSATLFKVVEQFSSEFLQQTEASPLAIAAVAGLVGGVMLGQVVPGGVVGKLPKDGIEDSAVVERRASAQVR